MVFPGICFYWVGSAVYRPGENRRRPTGTGIYCGAAFQYHLDIIVGVPVIRRNTIPGSGYQVRVLRHASETRAKLLLVTHSLPTHLTRTAISSVLQNRSLTSDDKNARVKTIADARNAAIEKLPRPEQIEKLKAIMAVEKEKWKQKQ